MTRDPDFRVAAALRALRERASLTQMETARRGGPDSRTISHWETGRKMPSLPLLHRHLKALGCNFCDFQLALDQCADEKPPRRLRSCLGAIERYRAEIDAETEALWTGTKGT